MSKEIIIILIVAVLAVIAGIATIFWIIKVEDKYIVVHTKTGNKYRIISKCKMKFDGNWMDAIAYMSLDTYDVYVRTYNDFTLNFKTLAEWKKERK